MKILLFTFLFLSFSAKAAISIISDLDDTIKITQASGDLGDLLGHDVYTGMPEFLKSARDYTSKLFVLSASPSFLRSKIINDFRQRGIKFEGLILRDNIFEDKFDYKVREISRILDRTDDEFILIGDDWGDDPEVFEEIMRLYPGRVIESYIHVVKGRQIPRSVVTYWTSFDLYLREFEAARMKQSRVKTALKKISAEKDMELIFPKKADCPTENSVWEWQLVTTFAREAEALMGKLTSFCQARQSINILP